MRVCAFLMTLHLGCGLRERDLAPESLPHHDPPQISTCLTGRPKIPHRHPKTRSLSRALEKSIEMHFDAV